MPAFTSVTGKTREVKSFDCSNNRWPISRTIKFACLARKSRSEGVVKDEALKKKSVNMIVNVAGIIDRFPKNLFRAEFTLIYISFYNSFTKTGNVLMYVCLGWIEW